MEFKDILKRLRQEKGLTQAALSAHFGKSDSAVRMWEIGKAQPDLNTLIKLADYFNCSTDYLLGLSDIKFLSSYDKDSEIRRLTHELEEIKASMYQIKALTEVG